MNEKVKMLLIYLFHSLGPICQSLEMKVSYNKNTIYYIFKERCEVSKLIRN